MRALVIAFAIVFVSCSGGDDIGGIPSGATCPSSGTPLTWENFGKDFFTTYCTSCHAANLTTAQRQGSPTTANFDTLEGVRSNNKKIDSRRHDMPPPPNKRPPDAEYQKLTEWLACGAPGAGP